MTVSPEASPNLPAPIPALPSPPAGHFGRWMGATHRLGSRLRAAQRAVRQRPDRAISVSKLFRTTAFKLSLAYLGFFAIGSAAVLGAVAWNANSLLDEQITQTIQAEINGLAEQYDVGGVRQLVDAVDRRTRMPGSSLYLVTNYAGETLAGNVGLLPTGVIEKTGLVETAYGKPSETKLKHLALARVFQLSGGFRLLVGRDLEERENLRSVMTHALVISLLWLVAIGLLGGIFVAFRVLRRVDAMNATARTIMTTGDMSRRLPIAGTGDELDRLAGNLNAMIARIGALMSGLKEVSDNIAHDLRTPLTRLRNGAEEALRHQGSREDQRAALEKIIAESDGLICVFNALLLIARAEAGTGRDSMTVFDATGLVQDLVELYEPVAEDAGVAFAVDVTPGLQVRGTRELLSQLLANLLDNALKYGAPRPELGTGGLVEISARLAASGVEFVVADNGEGIPDADRNRVLDRFVRLEHSRSRPGSGLGLSLVTAIAQMHGAALRLEDNKPGLRVVVQFPPVEPAVRKLSAEVPA